QHLRLWQIIRHACAREIVHLGVFDSDTLNRRIPAGREDRDAFLELRTHAFPCAPDRKLLRWRPVSRSAHPAPARPAKASARRMHDREQIPTLQKDAVANIATDMPVAAILGR